MAPHSSTLAWEIPWTEELDRLQPMGSLSLTWLNDFIFTFHFHALEKEMATRSSVLAWRIPGTGEPGGLLSLGLRRVGTGLKRLSSSCSIPFVYKTGIDVVFTFCILRVNSSLSKWLPCTNLICTVDFSCVMLNCARNSRKSLKLALWLTSLLCSWELVFWLEWDLPDKCWYS